MRKLSVKWEPDYWREHNLPDNGCFGYVNGHLVLGRAHHQLIMGNFIYKGWTMEQLLMAPQAWGWFTVNKISYYPEYFPNYDKMKDWQKNSSFIVAQFTSDAGIQVDEEVTAAMGAFSAMYHLPTKLSRDAKVRGVVEENFATGLRGIHNMDKYLEKPEYYFGEDFVGNNPHVLHGVPQPPGSDWNPEWSEDAVKPEDVHEEILKPKTVFTPGVNPFKGTYSIGDRVNVAYGGHNYGPGTVVSFGGHNMQVKLDDLNYTQNQSLSKPTSVKKLAPEGSPLSGYEGVYLNSTHPETSNHLHVTPDSATWKHPETGGIIGDSVMGFDSIKKSIDDGKLIKTEPDLGGFYEGADFSVHYDGVKNKATWTYPSGTQLGPSYVSPLMVKKYINEGSWNLVAKDEFKEPKTVIGPNTPLDGPKVGDKFYYTPDMEKENPQVYTVSEVSPHYIKITWPSSITDGVTYEPGQFNKVFTKVPPDADAGGPFAGYEGEYAFGAEGGSTLIVNTDKATWSGGNPTALKPEAIIKGINSGSLEKIAYTPGGKTKGWGDIMEKANYIRSQNGVNIINNEPQHVTGTVMSATDPQNRGPYNTEIWRDDPQSQAITMWDCDCDWDQYAWGRTRQWKKYEGRPCCHVLAMFWDALSNPPAGAQTAPGTPAAPPTPVPGGGVTVNQGLIAPMGQPPMPNVPLIGPEGEPAPISPAPAPGGPTNPAALPWSEVVQPGKGEGTITFPGTFSHRKQATKITEVGDESDIQDENDPERPWLYHPESDTLYLGPAGAFHYPIINHLIDHNVFLEKEGYPHGYLTEGGYAKTYGHGYPPRGVLDELGISKIHKNNESMQLSELRDSSWKEAAFQNGDIVRTWEETQGTIPPAWGQPEYLPVTIKKNQSGEVLYSDENTTVAIFPLSTGPLEPHLVKVECPTKNLYLDNTNAQPFVKKH